jgi:hypothetical protein
VEGPKQLLEEKGSIETLPISKESLGDGEMVESALDGKDLCAKRIRPETVKVVLKKIAK